MLGKPLNDEGARVVRPLAAVANLVVIVGIVVQTGLVGVTSGRQIVGNAAGGMIAPVRDRRADESHGCAVTSRFVFCVGITP